MLAEMQMMNTIEYRVDCQLLKYLHFENYLGCRSVCVCVWGGSLIYLHFENYLGCLSVCVGGGAVTLTHHTHHRQHHPAHHHQFLPKWCLGRNTCTITKHHSREWYNPHKREARASHPRTHINYTYFTMFTAVTHSINPSDAFDR